MTTDTTPTETPRDTPPKIVNISPPKRERKPSNARTSTGRKKSLTKPLTGTFATIGTMVSIANPTDGAIIIQGSERLAEALNNLAKENDRVYRALSAMIEVSVWGEVGGAVLAIVLPIMVNHDVLPVELPKSMVPDMGKDDDGT